MIVRSNTLKPVLDRDDRGRKFVEGIEGEIVIELEPSDLAEIREFMEAYDHERRNSPSVFRLYVWEYCTEQGIEHNLDGLCGAKWDLDQLQGNVATFTVSEFESCRVVEPEPDYDALAEARRERAEWGRQ